MSQTENTTVAGTPIKVEAVKVTAEKWEPKATTRYWLGVTNDSPYKPITVAGQDFPHVVDPPLVTAEGEDQKRAHMFGIVRQLTEEQVAKIQSAVARRVVRWNGPRTRAWILSIDNITYTREPNEEPLSKYLYLIRVEDRMPAGFRQAPGETMFQEPE